MASQAQVVHGDLGGNVLFAAGLPPAVIDWSPYWRPAGWALAVVVVDALVWEGAEPVLADRWSQLPEWPQLLARAAMYRLATAIAARPGTGPADADEAALFTPAVDTVLQSAAR